MKKLAYYIGILVCTGLFLSSCIGDDLSDCPTDGIVPQFILVPYEGNNIKNDSLYSAKVCVFDEQDNFVASYHIEGRPELNKIYTPNWGLPPGKYTYIAWLNYLENLRVNPCILGKSTRTQTLLQLIIPETRIIENTHSNIPFLCYGHVHNQELNDTADAGSPQENLITIPVMQLTNKINLRVTGLSNALLRASAADNHEYEFSITDNNGIYGFDGEFIPHDSFTYSTSKQVDSDVLETSLTVLKLSGTRQNPTFTIKNRTTGAQIYPVENESNNLIQRILSDIPDNDFNKNHEYRIDINFASDMEVSVTVSIIDWKEDPYNPELNIN
jgi:hypothetical protein